MIKKIFLLIFGFVFITGCVSMAVTTNKMTEKVTGSIRTMEEVDKDKKLEKSIRKQVKSDVKIFAEINNMKKVGSYNITVYDSRVLITGIIADARIKNFIYNKIWEFKGVKEVINELEVSYTDESNSLIDYFISLSVKNRLRFVNGIRSTNYDVVVSNKRAFVLGIAYSEDEMRKVGYVASTTKGVRDVVIHVILKEDSRRK